MTLRKEEEIIKDWKNPNTCLVSIDMLSYNHEPFIDTAIKSVLNQKTNFAYELLIHDDASSDSSQAIIKKYQALYPNIVKPILQTENQYSKGINPSATFNHPRAKSEYLAILEGDDCWTDHSKLQRQVDILEKNQHLNFCFHKASIIDYHKSTEESKTIGEYGNFDQEISFNDILFSSKGFIPTASCMIRSCAKENLSDFLKNRKYLTIGDYYIHFFGSIPNGGYYINRTMSLYRKHTLGSWTDRLSESVENLTIHTIAMLRSYIELNEITNLEYNTKFKALITQRIMWYYKKASTAVGSSNPSIIKYESDYNFIDNTSIPVFIKEITSTIANNLNNTIKEFDSLDKKIIYGSASGCETILRNIKKNHIYAIIDRDNKRVNDSMHDIKIININQSKKYKNKHFLVSTINSDIDQIIKTAISLGFNKKKIHFLFESAIHSVPIKKLYNEIKKSHSKLTLV